MANKKRSKARLPANDGRTDGDQLGRRGFLTAAGAAAASVAGLSGNAAAAQTSDGTDAVGYGLVAYGDSGYGGIQLTN